MTDIIDRLRQGIGHEETDVIAAELLMEEAAAQIELIEPCFACGMLIGGGISAVLWGMIIAALWWGL